jgi:hypothetical protein
LLYLPLWIGFRFIPNSFFFDTFLTLGFSISGLYLIVQMLFLIELFHSRNDRLLDSNRGCLMGVITAVLTLLSTAFGVCYWLFSSQGGERIAIMTVNLILCIALWILSVVIEHASFVALYVAFLTSTGMVADSSLTEEATPDATIFIIVAAVFTLVWLIYIAFTDSFGFQQFFPCFAREDGKGDCPCCYCLEVGDPARESCACLCSLPWNACNGYSFCDNVGALLGKRRKSDGARLWNCRTMDQSGSAMARVCRSIPHPELAAYVPEPMDGLDDLKYGPLRFHSPNSRLQIALDPLPLQLQRTHSLSHHRFCQIF